ncbi:MAG: hypothetical protein J6W96_04255 [Alphaproteobacteria bacterium]|nr:hypothetical protein [Alphaproteobacteria bacterium]
MNGGFTYDSLAFESRQQRFEEGVDARNEDANQVETNQGNDMLGLYSSRNNGNGMA